MGSAFIIANHRGGIQDGIRVLSFNEMIGIFVSAGFFALGVFYLVRGFFADANV